MPPASGIKAESSPYDKAPAMVRAPATTHATSNQPALPRLRAISAGTMKIPDPIMAPMTTMVESNRPNPRVKSRFSVVCGLGSAAASFTGTQRRLGMRNGLTIAYCIHKMRPCQLIVLAGLPLAGWVLESSR